MLPLVVHSDSGCGKSALLSMIAYNCKKWLKPTTVTVMRCIGQTPISVSIRDLLINICEQLTVIYNIDPPQESIIHSAVKVAYHFNHMLEQVSKWHADKRPLVLLLDGLEGLKDVNRAHTMFWLPKVLPSDVYIVLSVNDTHTMLQRLKVYAAKFVECIISCPLI